MVKNSLRMRYSRVCLKEVAAEKTSPGGIHLVEAVNQTNLRIGRVVDSGPDSDLEKDQLVVFVYDKSDEIGIDEEKLTFVDDKNVWAVV